MGLISTDPQEDADQLRAFWDIFLERWNAWYAVAPPHKASVSEEVIEPFLLAAKGVMEDVFPPKPSAFKRLGTFAVLIQHFPIVNLVHKNGTPFSSDEDCQWTPRLALAAAQVFASEMSVILPSGEQKLNWFRMPSPHFQLELISVLRNYRLGAHEDNDLDPDILSERALNASLILEACYYIDEIKKGGGKGYQKILGDVDGCLKDLDPIHQMDIDFHQVAIAIAAM